MVRELKTGTDTDTERERGAWISGFSPLSLSLTLTEYCVLFPFGLVGFGLVWHFVGFHLLVKLLGNY